jgi:hypothetical protein
VLVVPIMLPAALPGRRCEISGMPAGELHANAQITRLAMKGVIAFNRVVPLCEGADSRRVKYWEIIVENLHAAGCSLGWVSAIDSEGRTIWIVDAHGDDGKRFNVRADEIVTAFVELERAIQRFAVSLIM